MGKTNNPRGRPKGVPNVITSELRGILKGIIAGELESLPHRLEALSDEKRLDVLLRLLPYVCPRVNAISHLDGEPFEYDALTAMFVDG